MTPQHRPYRPAPAAARRPGWWLTRELAELARSHPRLHRVLHRVWQHPAVLVPLAAVALGVLGAATPDGDAAWFRSAGLGMVGPGFWDVFADPGLQIGVLVLLPVGLLTAAARALGLSDLLLVAAAQGALVTWVALGTARRVTRVTGAPALPAQWAVGSVLALGGLLADAVGTGHAEEILIGLLLVLAAGAAADGRGAAVGGLLGVAAGLKLWGVLGAPVALVGRRPRVVVGAAVVACAVTAVCYVPFFVRGEVNTFEFTWLMSNRTGLRELVGPGPSDWALRVAQGAAAFVVGCCVALRRSGSPLTVVLCVVSTRLLLDPLMLPYYLGPLVVVGLLWAWSSRDDVVRRAAPAATALVPVLVVFPYLVDTPVVQLVYLVLMVLVPACALVGDRRAARGIPAHTAGPAPSDRAATSEGGAASDGAAPSGGAGSRYTREFAHKPVPLCSSRQRCRLVRCGP